MGIKESEKKMPYAGTADPVRGVNLKELADAVGLSPGTLSVVLNNTIRANTIPKETRERIFKAAKDFSSSCQ